MPRIPVSTKYRLQSGHKMQTEHLKSFYVWYIITCHLAAYRASRNRFSAISLHDYLHYCGKFLAHFLMKIDRNIISSLQYIFLLCARVGWCDVCTDFTNVIKVDDVNNSNGKASLKGQKSLETRKIFIFRKFCKSIIFRSLYYSL